MTNASLLTTRDAATRLGCNTRQIARLVARGKLKPEVQAPGPRGAFFFTEAEIDRAKAEIDRAKAEVAA